jgi:hypothetical protein
MTLLDAPVYDERFDNKRRNLVIGILLFCAAAVSVFALCRNLPAEHRVNQFFAAVEAQDLPKAFGIWNNDPDWQKHPEEYAKDGYPYGRFVGDWGESGDYGRITSHKVLHSISNGNTTLLAVEINGRKEALALAVTRGTHMMSFPPFGLTPVKDDLGLTYWQVSYRTR